MSKMFGKYEVLGEVGSGGMAVVYKARDTTLDRIVALKVISHKLQGGESARRRFVNEARVAAALNHANIVSVYEFGVEDGFPFIAMEYLPGADLSDVIRANRNLPLRRKIGIALEVARALAHAHSRGVLHRDVKPSNIRLIEGGGVKLMDFGIAKITSEEATRLTRTGAVIGTAAYMSPEQVRGEQLTGATDIFAFGIVLYELLTCTRAFHAENPHTILFRILTAEPAEIVDPAVPPELKLLVEECLRKPVEERISSFANIVRRLAQIRKSLRPQDLEAEQPPELGRPAAATAPVPASRRRIAPETAEKVSTSEPTRQFTGSGLVSTAPLASVRADSPDELEQTGEDGAWRRPGIVVGVAAFGFAAAGVLIFLMSNERQTQDAAQDDSPRASLVGATKPPAPLPSARVDLSSPVTEATLPAIAAESTHSPTPEPVPSWTPIPVIAVIEPPSPTSTIEPTQLPTVKPTTPPTLTLTPTVVRTRVPTHTPTLKPLPTAKVPEPRPPTPVAGRVVRLGGAPDDTLICIDSQPWMASRQGPAWILNDVPVGTRKVQLAQREKGTSKKNVEIQPSERPQAVLFDDSAWVAPRFKVAIPAPEGILASVVEYRKKAASGRNAWVPYSQPRTQQVRSGGSFQFEGLVDEEYRIKLDAGKSLTVAFELARGDPDAGELTVEYSSGAQSATRCRRTHGPGCGELPPLECVPLN